MHGKRESRYLRYLCGVILALLALSFAVFAQAAKSPPSTSNQGLTKAVSQLETNQQSLQRQIDELKSLLGQRIDDFSKRMEDISKGFEKNLETTNARIQDLRERVDQGLTKKVIPAWGWRSLPTSVRILDGVFVLVGLFFTVGAYRSWTGPKEPRWLPAERNLGISAIGSFLTLTTTADSILLGLVGILSRWETASIPSSAYLTQLLASGSLFVLSIICGAISASYVINHVHFESGRESVVENPLVIGFAAGQLNGMVVGSLFILIALFL